MSERTLKSLEVHRENVAAAKTWEEFQAAQLKYIDYLIKSSLADKAAKDAVREFADVSVAFTTRAEWRDVTDHPVAEAGDGKPS